MKRIVSKDPVKDFNGIILGWVETDEEGNQRVRDFKGFIVATYDKSMNVTREFSGRIITRGNTAIGMLFKK